MKKLNDIFLTAKKTVLDPGGAAIDLMAPGAGLNGPLAVYLAYCAAYSLYIYFRPADFPADFAETALEFSGKSYAWIFTVQTAFELAFTGAFCAFFAAFAGFLKDGRLAFKFLAGCAACGAYAAAALYFKAEPLFALPFLAAAGAAAYAGARAKKSAAAAFFSFSLAVNAAMLLCLPVVALATALRNEPLFTAAECAGGLWMMILTIKAARTFFGGTTARLTPALLFALLAAMSSFYILKNLGVIPPAIFRFIMFM